MNSITVITATKNSERFLSMCLDSVVNQDCPTNHVLIDGASTDSTLEICKKYDHHLTQIVSEPDQGIYDALNKGVQLATGEVICILHADDFYPANDVISTVMREFDDPAVEACFGDLKYVDRDNTGRTIRYWRSGDFSLHKMLWGWMPPHPAFFVRRSVYEKYGLFNTEMGTSADYEIMLRFLLKHRINVTYIPKVLVHMRSGGISNRSLVNRIRANRMDRLAWEVNKLKPYPWTMWMKPMRKITQWFVQG